MAYLAGNPHDRTTVIITWAKSWHTPACWWSTSSSEEWT
jgi:hypothetical protein